MFRCRVWPLSTRGYIMMLITDECRSLTKFDELMLSWAKKLEQDLKKWQNILFIDAYIINRYYSVSVWGKTY